MGDVVAVKGVGLAVRFQHPFLSPASLDCGGIRRGITQGSLGGEKRRELIHEDFHGRTDLAVDLRLGEDVCQLRSLEDPEQLV